ncbi:MULTISPECIES: pseudouridine synthase [unclassified Ruminococcus]|uniref:pseudouridine synthase n=1 Tax=unclassified Ruminococcus TaxID=2608920 RepID=UPI00210DFDD6|nr:MULTISPECIES: pseudouridine synthase [unclassified Ruminococcus]MCQ4021895.1 pseudouridine synthase [Ruminococcus sp. zg-924]MCQ4114340.1 pseudouridine synthase [Ruminococcus sp. zg-921]
MHRLDKIISQRTVYTRSEIKRLIKSGAVTVGGKVCKSPDIKLAEDSEIRVNGEKIGEKFLYLMMNKPEGVVCAVRDNTDKTVIDILPPEYHNRGLFPAGRLDKDTTGLLILTNDGEFSHSIMSPNKKVEKYYIAETDKPLKEEHIRLFEQGIVFRDGTKCKSAFAENLESGENFRIGVKICEGKYHQVKKMLAVCKINVLKLTRFSIGSLSLDVNLYKGECRKLTDVEIEQIFLVKFN